MSNTYFSLNTPLDMHIHFREGDMLRNVAPLSAETFSGGVIMPNLVPPVDNLKRLNQYEQEIRDTLKGYVFEEPVTLKSEDYPPIVIECEFGFRLGSDLPKRPTPYEREEVEDAICEVHPTIEVVAGHLIDWPNQDVWSVIADNGTDGALIYGAGCKLWRGLDLVRSQVTLTVNGKCERTGYGANVLDDPLDALVWLANARSRDGDGLRAGDIHNTGTATDIYWAISGDQIVAEFQSLGKVSVRII